MFNIKVFKTSNCYSKVAEFYEVFDISLIICGIFFSRWDFWSFNNSRISCYEFSQKIYKKLTCRCLIKYKKENFSSGLRTNWKRTLQPLQIRAVFVQNLFGDWRRSMVSHNVWYSFLLSFWEFLSCSWKWYKRRRTLCILYKSSRAQQEA